MGNDCSACNCQKAEKNNEFQLQVTFFQILFIKDSIIKGGRGQPNSKII